MRYAQILCILSGARDDEATLLAAAELAKREKAVVKVIPSLMLTDAVVWADAFGTTYIAASAIEEIAAGQVQMRKDMAALARRTAKAVGIEYDGAAAPSIVMIQDPGADLRTGEREALGEIVAADREPAWRLLDREGPLADLVVVGEATLQREGLWAGSPGQALMGVRAPILVVRAAETVTGGVVAIAWDGSLPAGRAVRGALPLLRAAKRVVILQDPDGMTVDEKAAGAPERLIAYLGLHGIDCMEVKTVTGGREARALLAGAENEGASVMVAGAFGHSQLREALIGGTTRALTRGDSGPHLLLAH